MAGKEFIIPSDATFSNALTYHIALLYLTSIAAILLTQDITHYQPKLQWESAELVPEGMHALGPDAPTWIVFVAKNSVT